MEAEPYKSIIPKSLPDNEKLREQVPPHWLHRGTDNGAGANSMRRRPDARQHQPANLKGFHLTGMLAGISFSPALVRRDGGDLAAPS
jgi:hypothetical protein